MLEFGWASTTVVKALALVRLMDRQCDERDSV